MKINVITSAAFVDENGNISEEEPSVFPNIVLKHI